MVRLPKEEFVRNMVSLSGGTISKKKAEEYYQLKSYFHDFNKATEKLAVKEKITHAEAKQKLAERLGAGRKKELMLSGLTAREARMKRNEELYEKREKFAKMVTFDPEANYELEFRAGKNQIMPLYKRTDVRKVAGKR